MESKPTYTIQRYARGQYIVLDPQGFDVCGDWMSLHEARQTVQRYKYIDKALANLPLLIAAGKLCDRAYVATSESDKEAAMEYLHNVILFLDADQIRSLINRPKTLASFVEQQNKLSSEAQAKGAKYSFFYSMDRDFMRLLIANMISQSEFSVSKVDEVMGIIYECSTLEDLQFMANDLDFMKETISANI